MNPIISIRYWNRAFLIIVDLEGGTWKTTPPGNDIPKPIEGRSHGMSFRALPGGKAIVCD